MSVFFSTFFSFSFIIILLWFYLFAYLAVRLINNKFSVNNKLFKYQEKAFLSDINYKKILYLLTLMFLLGQAGPDINNFYNSIIIISTNNHSDLYQKFIFIKKIFSIFTLFSFYLFIFAFYVADSNKDKNSHWKVISFVVLFLNLLLNLIFIPNQVIFLLSANLLSVSQLLSLIFSFFIYFLILKIFLNFFKYFFNFSIIKCLKLTLFVFNYQKIKNIFLKKNKNNIITFIHQLLAVCYVVSENEKPEITIISKNFDYLKNSNVICDDAIIKKNFSFYAFNKITRHDSMILKDYIIINGWKMSLIQ